MRPILTLCRTLVLARIIEAAGRTLGCQSQDRIVPASKIPRAVGESVSRTKDIREEVGLEPAGEHEKRAFGKDREKKQDVE
ncbi:hypothetical protein DdX_08862 [Ditylenchus destructor]|uniref:Uncharacterized protein n=1 Tax=Ditylenchus destructor TaxID=166010 RepID=A0AAD4R748_9BILA|nr:hypothetical protein DdX_08862 [Ditylenchus destructor]